LSRIIHHLLRTSSTQECLADLAMAEVLEVLLQACSTPACHPQEATLEVGSVVHLPVATSEEALVVLHPKISSTLECQAEVLAVASEEATLVEAQASIIQTHSLEEAE
jgi:hypothetical protein